MADNTTRKSWADLCRVIAIFGVVVIHACGATFYKFGKIPEVDWLSANIIDSIFRCSVPLFVMLSGALILNKGDEAITLLHVFKRIVKVVIPLLVWNVVYLSYVSHFTGQAIDWLSMLREPPMYHLWFVYMVVGLYLLLPVLQAIFLMLLTRRDLQAYFLIIWFVITCVPTYLPVPFLSLIQQTSIFGYGGYFLIGGLVAASDVKKRLVIFWVGVYFVAVAITFLLTWYFSVQASVPVETAYLYFSPNVFMASIASFILILNLHIEGVFLRVVRWISDRSFLIFFIHVVILEHAKNYVNSFSFAMPMLIEILLISGITFIVCLIIASMLRILPKSREILG